MKIILFFNRFSAWSVGVFSFVLLLIVALVDDITGYQIGFSFFYLIPISLATLRFGKRGGITLAILSSLLWVASDIDSGHPYLHPYYTYVNGSIRLGVFLVVAYLLWSLRSEWEKEAKISQRDPLTDVLNRRAFEKSAGDSLEKCGAREGNFVLVYLDLDNFKGTNDAFGHSAGDEILQKFAQTLKGVRHPDYLLGRLGGDEFVLLLTEIDWASAEGLLDRLRLEVAEKLANIASGVTVSIGAAAGSGAAGDLNTWIKRADKLMYESKKTGKNRLTFVEFPAG